MTSDHTEQFLERCDEEESPCMVFVPCGHDCWRVIMGFGEDGARSVFHIPSSVFNGITNLVIEKDNQHS